MVSYLCGVYDILRAKELQEIDKQIQLSKEDGAKYFGIGIYDSNLCENLGLNEPLKSLEDRMAIMQQIRGVDFVFPVNSLDSNIINSHLRDAYTELLTKGTGAEKEKIYEIGYAPGTYDLFHAGHLENLMIASSQCKRLIVGVKADELVLQHKGREPIISAEERKEIVRHFRFVHEAYIYYTRDLHIANDWVNSKYGKDIGAIFLGSDLENDFKDTEGLNIIYTPRDPKLMKTRSTTAYRKLHLGRTSINLGERFVGNIAQVSGEFTEKNIGEDGEFVQGE